MHRNALLGVAKNRAELMRNPISPDPPPVFELLAMLTFAIPQPQRLLFPCLLWSNKRIHVYHTRLSAFHCSSSLDELHVIVNRLSTAMTELTIHILHVSLSFQFNPNVQNSTLPPKSPFNPTFATTLVSLTLLKNSTGEGLQKTGWIYEIKNI